jgi:hypothetical protein
MPRDAALLTAEVVEHQAICADCRYAGHWHSDQTVAENDALEHRRRPGKQNHRVFVRSQQSSGRAVP